MPGEIFFKVEMKRFNIRFYPFFTGMIQPAYMMGQLAVELLMNRIKKPAAPPTRIMLKSDFVPRNSVRELTEIKAGIG
jgi:DNA-binding LacI/PurR family transcriptional regulator